MNHKKPQGYQAVYAIANLLGVSPDLTKRLAREGYLGEPHVHINPVTGARSVYYSTAALDEIREALESGDIDRRESRNALGGNAKRPACGTYNGYQAHQRRGESCDACRQAMSAYKSAQYRAKRNTQAS